MMESCCDSPEKFIDRSYSSGDDQEVEPTQTGTVLSYLKRNSKKLMLVAAVFALMGVIGFTSQSKQRAKKGSFSLGKKVFSKSAKKNSKGLRGSSKSSKSLSKSKSSSNLEDLKLGNLEETTLVDVEALNTTQPYQQEDADLIQAGLSDEFIEGSFLEEEIVDISETTEEEAASTADGLLDEPSEVAELDDRSTDEESSSAVEPVEETSAIIDVGEGSSTVAADVMLANIDEEEEEPTEAAADADGSSIGDTGGGADKMGDADIETESVTEAADATIHADVENQSLTEAAVANTGSDAETTSVTEAADATDADAEAASVTEESDANPEAQPLAEAADATDADTETASLSEASDATSVADTDTESFSEEADAKTGADAETTSLSQASATNSDANTASTATEDDDKESAPDADNTNGSDSGASSTSSASNLSGGDNSSSSASSSSSNSIEDNGSSSNGSNGASDYLNANSSSGYNVTGDDNTSSAYGDGNGSSYANDASSETEIESTNDSAEGEEEDPTAEENVTRSDNYVNLATKPIGNDPAATGFLSMVAIGAVAFFALGLYTNLKSNKKEAAAATGGGTLDPLEDDSSIWSANEGIGDMDGPGVSGLAAMGANSRVAIQLSGVSADASVVSGLTGDE